ncbi:MAG: hypothetical protein QNJ05_09700 [Woeseiaceae bacterium]|nr:hypothetical protein [Woeseiaceae bacterium]
MFNSINRDDLKLSIRDGIYFPFIYKGHQVVAHNSAWSFREKIWIDDSLVVSQLGFKMTGTHTVDVAGDRMEIQFGYRDGMKTVFLTARVDGRVVHEVVHEINSEVKPWAIVAFAAAGAAAGYGVGYLVGLLIGGA